MMPQLAPPAVADSRQSGRNGEDVRLEKFPGTYGELIGLAWPRISRGVVMAGGAYPLVLGALYVLLAIAASLANGDAAEWGAAGLFMLAGVPFVAAAAGFVGMVWTAVVTLFALPMVRVFCWTLDLRPNLIWLGAMFGGLVGFLAASPMLLDMPRAFEVGRYWEAIAMLVLGPGLTVPLGQLGGALGARAALRDAVAKAERHRELVAIGWRTDAAQGEVGESRAGAEGDQHYFRFRTAHLLWIAVWLGLLLTVVRASGIPYGWFVPVILGWVAYQGVTLWAGWRIGPFLEPWWQRRFASRST